ncbi:hypothetical protein AAMO2058_001074900 [Amorphochlora amoebiformis]
MDFDDNGRYIEPKVVVLGQTGVGKTSMIHRYTKGDFKSNTQTTIGGAYCKKVVKVKGWNVSLHIWDTAGQERFRSMAPMYYRGAKAGVLVYDCTEEGTLNRIKGWYNELSKHAAKDFILVLAGNKCDATQITAKHLDKAQKIAGELGAKLFQTSAKTGKGLNELFHFVAVKTMELCLKEGKTADGVAVTRENAQSKTGCC